MRAASISSAVGISAPSVDLRFVFFGLQRLSEEPLDPRLGESGAEAGGVPRTAESRRGCKTTRVGRFAHGQRYARSHGYRSLGSQDWGIRRVRTPTTPSSLESAVSYKNCSEARAAGAAPILRGEPPIRAIPRWGQRGHRLRQVVRAPVFGCACHIRTPVTVHCAQPERNR
ncbi:excalibur calcium-binding domain-containing protein [Rhodococcus rhodochrous]|uniref:excalibur calcium-binding domain-containing protein n=1 Tax=Rhodococcus rhodochrous TaxID=1829 RepID=UPI0030B86E53